MKFFLLVITAMLLSVSCANNSKKTDTVYSMVLSVTSGSINFNRKIKARWNDSAEKSAREDLEVIILEHNSKIRGRYMAKAYDGSLFDSTRSVPKVFEQSSPVKINTPRLVSPSKQIKRRGGMKAFFKNAMKNQNGGKVDEDAYERTDK